MDGEYGAAAQCNPKFEGLIALRTFLLVKRFKSKDTCCELKPRTAEHRRTMEEKLFYVNKHMNWISKVSGVEYTRNDRKFLQNKSALPPIIENLFV